MPWSPVSTVSVETGRSSGIDDIAGALNGLFGRDVSRDEKNSSMHCEMRCVQ